MKQAGSSTATIVPEKNAGHTHHVAILDAPTRPITSSTAAPIRITLATGIGFFNRNKSFARAVRLTNVEKIEGITPPWIPRGSRTTRASGMPRTGSLGANG